MNPRSHVAYLDHAASTPVRDEVAADLRDELLQVGNPSSLHSAGRRARGVVERGRERLAGQAMVDPRDVVFTSGGTEANNLAVKGSYWRARRESADRRRIVIGATEHPSVMVPALWLAEHSGAIIDVVAVDPDGVIDLDALDRALREPSAITLVAIMAANNETGVLAPLKAIAERCREARVYWHCDAVQAGAWYGLDEIAALLNGIGSVGTGRVSVALSGHKLGAPAGIGALVGAGADCLDPLLHGGGQEGGLRSGTTPAALVSAFATAVSLSAADAPRLRREVGSWRNDFVARVLAEVPDAVCHSPLDATAGLPGHALMTFPGAPADLLLTLLDQAVIACSAGSACSAGFAQASPTLTAMGLSADRARSAVRFSLGWPSTADDLTRALAALPEIVRRARAAAADPGASGASSSH